MTTKDVARMVYRRYSGGDPSDDSGLELEDFVKAVESARAWKILDDYRKAIRLLGEMEINEAWLKSYEDVPVILNEATNTYYSDLPEMVLGLPKGNGIYFVSRMQDIGNPFAKMSTSDVFVMSELFNLAGDTTIYYRQDMNKISYMAFDPAIKTVFMQIVPLTSDDIPDEFVLEITEAVMKQFLLPKQNDVVEDKLDNSNPNKREIK